MCVCWTVGVSSITAQLLLSKPVKEIFTCFQFNISTFSCFQQLSRQKVENCFSLSGSSEIAGIEEKLLYVINVTIQTFE